MAYVYYPPRTSNFFPPGPPYLAGLRGYGMRGLGDYASDLAAYTVANNKWRLAKLAYDRDVKAYGNKIKAVDAAYAAALAKYNADKAAWDNEAAAYSVAMTSWNANNRLNAERSMKIASTYGLNLTQGYYQSGACLTQAQHNEYARQCVTVRGIGYLRGLGSTDANCGMKALPVCVPPPTLRAKPTPPARGAYPAKPVSPGPQPIAPTPPATTTPTTIPTTIPTTTPTTPSGPVTTPVSVPDTTPVVADDPKQANVLMGGLIVAAVVVGGYLVYRTVKKPKAA